LQVPGRHLPQGFDLSSLRSSQVGDDDAAPPAAAGPSHLPGVEESEPVPTSGVKTMATLYLTEQGSILRKTSDRLIVDKDHTVLLEVPCLKIDTVLIFGNVQVTTQALAELLEHGIELALLSTSGKLRGQLTPPNPKNIRVRMRQYELAHSEESSLGIAKRFVNAKIANSAAV